MNKKSLCDSTKKTLLFGALGLVVLALSGMAAAEEASASDQPDDRVQADVPALRFKGLLPETLPIPGDPRPYGNSPFAEEIDKALAYMVFKDRGPNRALSLSLLDYFQRRYFLHERYSLKATMAPHLDQAYADELGNFRRLVEPEFVPDESAIADAGPYEQPALRALYCDHIPVDSELLQEMLSQANEGMSPFLPGIALAYRWLRENDCLTAERQLLMLTRDNLAIRFRNHLRDEGPGAFMSGHSLSMLYAVGRGDMVDEAWLEGFAELQNEDGGWSSMLSPGAQGESDGGATVSILWGLLEQALPDLPAVPLFLRGDTESPDE